MKPLPVHATDLVRELDREFPQRCIGPTEDLTAAHRYAGKRDLIEGLLRRLGKTEGDERDPLTKLLENH